jgi:isocitrate/isopropylmalate dehydrogenase
LAGRAIAAAHRCVDVAALDLVRRPWDFDVMIAENMRLRAPSAVSPAR